MLLNCTHGLIFNKSFFIFSSQSMGKAPLCIYKLLQQGFAGIFFPVELDI